MAKKKRKRRASRATPRRTPVRTPESSDPNDGTEKFDPTIDYIGMIKKDLKDPERRRHIQQTVGAVPLPLGLTRHLAETARDLEEYHAVVVEKFRMLFQAQQIIEDIADGKDVDLPEEGVISLLDRYPKFEEHCMEMLEDLEDQVARFKEVYDLIGEVTGGIADDHLPPIPDYSFIRGMVRDRG